MEAIRHMRRIIIASALVLSLYAPASADDCLQVTEGCTPVVSFDLHDAELRDFLESTALKYGINMVISSDVGGRVSANLRDVDLFDAIDSIISSRGFLRREIKGGLMVVEPASESDLRERDLMVREFRLMYVDVEDAGIMNTISGVLSKRGKVMSVEGSNSLVVKDVAMGIDRAEALLASIDKEPRQVIVEARMVEIAKGSASELGINWGARHSETSGNVFGGLGTVEESFSVNLPDVQGQEAAPGALLGFSVISDRVSLDLRIQALETAREARTVSSPRVQVAENTKAVIADGEEILVPSADTQMVVSGGAGKVEGISDELKTFKAVLGLSVTPRVVAPGRVALEIEVRREWFDYEKYVEGFPTKITKTVSTNLIINNGETIAIGGIETGMNAESEARVPLLSRIPILGALFRSKAKESEMRELVIFLTPYIVEREEDVAGTGQINPDQ